MRNGHLVEHRIHYGEGVGRLLWELDTGLPSQPPIWVPGTGTNALALLLLLLLLLVLMSVLQKCQLVSRVWRVDWLGYALPMQWQQLVLVRLCVMVFGGVIAGVQGAIRRLSP
jgi:hypothetical protein